MDEYGMIMRTVYVAAGIIGGVVFGSFALGLISIDEALYLSVTPVLFVAFMFFTVQYYKGVNAEYDRANQEVTK